MADTRTRAQRYSDNIAEFCGSWGLIVVISASILGWMALCGRIDPYPYIFMNLLLTIISTMQSPIIMMSQNRQVERDRDNVNGLHAKLDGKGK